MGKHVLYLYLVMEDFLVDGAEIVALILARDEQHHEDLCKKVIASVLSNDINILRLRLMQINIDEYTVNIQKRQEGKGVVDRLLSGVLYVTNLRC